MSLCEHSSSWCQFTIYHSKMCVLCSAKIWMFWNRFINFMPPWSYINCADLIPTVLHMNYRELPLAKDYVLRCSLDPQAFFPNFNIFLLFKDYKLISRKWVDFQKFQKFVHQQFWMAYKAAKHLQSKHWSESARMLKHFKNIGGAAHIYLLFSIVTEDKSSDEWLPALRNSDIFLDNQLLPITMLLMWWNIQMPYFPLPWGILVKCHMHFSPTLRKQNLHIKYF